MKRSLIVRKSKAGSSGFDVILFGMMLMIVFAFINMVQSTNNIMSHRKDMIDSNITLSLLSVDVADKELLGNSNIIALAGTTGPDVNTPSIREVAWTSNNNGVSASQVPLIVDLVDAMSNNFGDTTTNKNDLLIKNSKLFGPKGYMVIKEIVIIDKKPVTEVHKYRITDGNKFGVYRLYGIRYSLAGDNSPYDNEGNVVDNPFHISNLGNGTWLSVHDSQGVSQLNVSGQEKMSWTPDSTWYKDVVNGTTWKDVTQSEYNNYGKDLTEAGGSVITDGIEFPMTADTLFSLDRKAFYDIYKAKEDYGKFSGESLQYIEGGVSIGHINRSNGMKETQQEIDDAGNLSSVNITDCTIAIRCDIYFDIIHQRQMTKKIFQKYDSEDEREAALKNEDNLIPTSRIRMVQLKRNEGATSTP